MSKVIQLRSNISAYELESLLQQYRDEVDCICNKDEIWRTIGHSGRNLISNQGRVKSYPYTYKDSIGRTRLATGGLRKLIPNQYGYLNVMLDDVDTSLVHRMVAIAFIPNPCGASEVNHLDFDTTNNRVENLEWCSHVDNIQHTIRAGRRVLSDVHKQKLIKGATDAACVPVVLVETMRRFNSKKQAADELNISTMSIDASIKDKICIKHCMTFIEEKDLQLDSSFSQQIYLDTAYKNYEARSRRNTSVRSHPIRRCDTGEIFSSINEAGRQLQLDTDGIRRNLKKHRPFHNILFEYVEEGVKVDG